MSSLNKCEFIGRLVKDPEMRITTEGISICKFTIAVDGYKEKDVEFVNIVSFKKLAEICGQYLVKGSLCYCCGRQKTSSWEKEGVKHYKTEIQLEQMQMLGKKEEKNAGVPTKQEREDDIANDEDIENCIPF